MSEFLKTNLIFLRTQKGQTQSETASALGLSRSTYANYENGDNAPKSDKLTNIVRFFGVTLDELLNVDLRQGNLNEIGAEAKNANFSNPKGNVTGNLTGKNRQFLQLSDDHIEPGLVSEPAIVYESFQAPKVVTVDSSGRENISYVSVKARAGYLLGFGDPAYIEKLPAFTVPGYTHGTYRLFEVDGHSMFPTLQASDRVITRWAGISEVRDDRVYVIVTKNDGVLIKRIINRYQEGKIIAKSDNNHGGEFPALVLDLSEISEIWYVVERWTRQLPGPGEIYKRIVNLEAELALLKHRLNQSG